MRSVLLDTGPLVALFASDDAHYDKFDSLIAKLSVQGLMLLTTWPCVVEASYLLAAQNRYEMLAWIGAGGAQIFPFEPQHLEDMARWMQRYTETSKREMDFADASLYWLATESGVRDVLTVDVADFSRYRLPDGSRFSLL